MTLYRSLAFVTMGSIYFTKSGFQRATERFDPNALKVDLKGKVYVVTGANKGLGYSTALYLAQQGARVHVLCRNQTAGQEAVDAIKSQSNNDQVVLHQVDVSNTQSIRDFVASYQQSGERLDCLINNAGVLLNERQVSAEGYEMTFATNLLGPFLLTNLLMPVLQKSAPSRVITVSSAGMYTQRLHPDDLESKTIDPWDGAAAYAQTKRAEVLLTERWARVFANSGVRFYSMHPGWADTPGVQTSIPSFHSAYQGNLRTPDEGADTIKWLAATPTLDTNTEANGKFFFDREIARQHLALASTDSTESEVDTMWNKLCEISGWSIKLQ